VAAFKALKVAKGILATPFKLVTGVLGGGGKGGTGPKGTATQPLFVRVLNNLGLGSVLPSVPSVDPKPEQQPQKYDKEGAKKITQSAKRAVGVVAALMTLQGPVKGLVSVLSIAARAISGPIVLGITAAVGAFNMLTPVVRSVRDNMDKISNIGDYYKDLAMDVVDKMTGGLSNAIESIGNYLGQAADGIRGVAASFYDTLNSIPLIADAFSSVGNIVNKIKEYFVSVFEGLMSSPIAKFLSTTFGAALGRDEDQARLQGMTSQYITSLNRQTLAHNTNDLVSMFQQHGGSATGIEASATVNRALTQSPEDQMAMLQAVHSQLQGSRREEFVQAMKRYQTEASEGGQVITPDEFRAIFTDVMTKVTKPIADNTEATADGIRRGEQKNNSKVARGCF
jgi:hypothetical protein